MPTVLVENEGGLTILTLNRPEQLNAFNDDQHELLRENLERARDDDNCRAILLTGAGRGFCAGQDLGDRNPDTMDGPPDLGYTLDTFYNPLIRLIRSIPKPVICAVNGVAAGAGANIAFACDMVLAAKSAKFIEAFSKIGLVPDSGGTWTLPRLVGEARAKAMIMTAEPVLADEAERIGLIYKCVADDDLLTEAKALAGKFASGPTFGFGLTKQAVHASANNTLDAQLDLERDLQREAGRSSDYAEGVRAFMQKRAPKFEGK
ncbi:MAG: 2-(1,2-epoxy-1,2-dihydrophenyl)acetyl-CoA isomerase PaaG [Pseudomonadota bacterium]